MDADMEDPSGVKKHVCEHESYPHISPISCFFFCWMIPLFWKGRKSDLNTSDLGKAFESDLSEPLGNELESYWFKEIERVERRGKGEKPQLLRVLFSVFIWGYLIDGFLLFIQLMICKPFQPVLLALVISEFSPGNPSFPQKVSLYAGGLVGLSLLSVIINHHTNLRQQQRGMRIRVACCSLLYRKLLRLSSAAISQTTAGQLVNIMSNDVNRFDVVLVFLHCLWILPFQIALICYLLYQQVGLSAVVGVTSITIQTLPVQSYLTKWSSKLRLKIAKRTDERVRLMNEIISGIQVIKMYAWEKPFEKIISSARAHELSAVTYQSFIKGIYMGFVVFTERASLYITLLAYSFLGNPISASAVFSLAQFFNKLQETLAFNYQNAMSMGAECLVTVRRIQEFILLEEGENDKKIKDDKNQEKTMPYNFENLGFAPDCINNDTMKETTQYEDEDLVQLEDVNASWMPNQSTLSNLNISVGKGKLCAIIGSVGAGKSSILHLLLKELPINSGTVRINGTISYASQEPWLFVDTIRNNIIFGQPYDKSRYQRVVRVCALEKDFEQFPSRDKTLVGERGVSLSGGQRARINLARAVYRKADIYLLDDPLSAVDTHVGRHLFDQCIEGFLGNKTRILVTHQLHYLKMADLIVILQNGCIEGLGTYDELASTGKDFSNLLVELQESKDGTEGDTANKKTLKKEPTLKLISVKNEFEDEDELDDELEVHEDTGSGKIKMDMYWKYWAAGRNNALVIFMIFAMIFGQFTATASDYWVTFWSNQQSKVSALNATPIYETSSHVSEFNRTEVLSSPSNFNDTFDINDKVGPLTTLEYLYVYTGLILACVFFITARSFLFFIACMKSSKGLHDQMFHKILRAKMLFFDTNPSGRILNRFSKDVGAVDELLPRAMIDVVQISLVFCSIMVLVSVTNPWLVLLIAIVLVLFYITLSFYLRTAQNVKRIESTTRSPVFSHLSATMTGIITIRAFNSQKRLTKEFDLRQDSHTPAWYNYIACSCTLGFWLDIICVIFLTVVCFSFIFIDGGNASSGNVGLAISQTLILMGMLQFGIRQTTEVIAQMTSVERIMQYTNLEEEAGLDKGDRETPANWPDEGKIEFVKTNLKYSPTAPHVLKNLNFCVESGWKVGIIGRTGAGKSSLISALFRLADIEGSIRIDEIDTKEIILQDIRSNISIIPQEPVLFCATIRYNLDPLNKYDDASLWSALEAVELKEGIPSLEYSVTEGGSNLSLGQRQLICLARAILSNNRILVLDEATANVDPQTDFFIQKTIREKFAHCTVLTIAHRLNTIMDSDRVLVMDAGRAVEFDHPHLLLRNSNGYLYKMVMETGSKMAANLMNVAMNAYINAAEVEDPKSDDGEENLDEDSEKSVHELNEADSVSNKS